MAVYLCVIFPAGTLLPVPTWLGASWPTLVRTDFGLVLMVAAVLRAAIGIVRFGGWVAGSVGGLALPIPWVVPRR